MDVAYLGFATHARSLSNFTADTAVSIFFPALLGLWRIRFLCATVVYLRFQHTVYYPIVRQLAGEHVDRMRQKAEQDDHEQSKEDAVEVSAPRSSSMVASASSQLGRLVTVTATHRRLVSDDGRRISIFRMGSVAPPASPPSVQPPAPDNDSDWWTSRWFRVWVTCAAVVVAAVFLGSTVARVVQQRDICRGLVGEDVWQASSPKAYFAGGLFSATTCGFEHILRLRVHSASIVSTDSIVAHYTALQELDLSGCGLTRLDQPLRQLRSLSLLDVSRNAISFVDPSIFLSRALRVQLQDNPVARRVVWDGANVTSEHLTSPSFVAALGSSLEVLSLRRNFLAVVPLSVLGHFGQLRELDLSHCSLVGWGAVTPALRRLNMRQLIMVNLSHNALTAVPDDLSFEWDAAAQGTVDLRHNRYHWVSGWCRCVGVRLIPPLTPTDYWSAALDTI